MVLQTRANPLESPDQGSFAALMELYEMNYIYLRRLVPQLDGRRDAQVSSVDRGPDLHLEVTERCPYTTSLLLTHRFEARDGEESLPDLRVRIYHDARVAEVMAEFPPAAPALLWRWESNRFLNRWLRYCLGEGHAFDANNERPVVERPQARRWAV
ncbi:MAG: DUF1249 domain-containing protein [Spiribacter sp.]|nr:DUF1249 domain-containing protein [Spiribacter sp.]MDR9455449.1 DUF1249 domain-containing protein [Spiribacter sp.]